MLDTSDVEAQPLLAAGRDRIEEPDPFEVAPVAAIAHPKDLYTLLTSRGYGVDILKRDAHGNMVFYVTIPGNPQEADLLVVDSTYTKVIQRKHIAAYGHERPAPYTTASAAGDNCERTAGY